MGTLSGRAVIGVVGVCGSGKSTLVAGLRKRGIEIHHIAQEHSYVQSMWQKIGKAELLIFLDASYSETMRRRDLNWTEEEYQEQQRRLQNARENADLYLFTDPIDASQVLEKVLAFLKENGIEPDPSNRQG